MKKETAVPVMFKFAREIDIQEAAMVAGGDTVGSTSKKSTSAAFIETLNESGGGPDTVNGKAGTGYTETYG